MIAYQRISFPLYSPPIAKKSPSYSCRANPNSLTNAKTETTILWTSFSLMQINNSQIFNKGSVRKSKAAHFHQLPLKGGHPRLASASDTQPQCHEHQRPFLTINAFFLTVNAFFLTAIHLFLITIDPISQSKSPCILIAWAHCTTSLPNKIPVITTISLDKPPTLPRTAPSRLTHYPFPKPLRLLRYGNWRAQTRHVRRLQPLGPWLAVELHRLAFFQRAEALGRDRSVMDKNILSTLAADKPESLRIIEPLDLPLCASHDNTPIYNSRVPLFSAARGFTAPSEHTSCLESVPNIALI